MSIGDFHRLAKYRLYCVAVQQMTSHASGLNCFVRLPPDCAS
jgi:hypothetical protein